MESISEQLKKDRLLKGMVHCREFFVLLDHRVKEFLFLFLRVNISYLQIHRKMVTAGTN